MVLRILRVRVDLAARKEHESGRLRVLDDERFSHVAGINYLLHSRPRPRAMLLDAEFAAMLQRAVERAQVNIELSVLDPVMNVPKREHAVEPVMRVEAGELTCVQC